jgi:hypothetical protein
LAPSLLASSSSEGATPDAASAPLVLIDSEGEGTEVLRDVLADVEVGPLLGGVSNDSVVDLLYEQR